MKNFRGAAAMIAATLLWGFASSAQSAGMRFIDPVVFTALRSIIAAAAMTVLVVIFDLFLEKRLSIWGRAVRPEEKRELLTGGLWCGVILAAASTIQQYGLKYTTAGKTGFLTALYIVIVPVLGILFKRKTSPVLWVAVALAMTGSYLLCGGVVLFPGTVDLGKHPVRPAVSAFLRRGFGCTRIHPADDLPEISASGNGNSADESGIGFRRARRMDLSE